jgi:predicted outer membrane protein
LRKKVAGANTFEIQSSELAKERAQSSDVKSFADQMIADHTKAGEDFKSAVQAAILLARRDRTGSGVVAALREPAVRVQRRRVHTKPAL